MGYRSRDSYKSKDPIKRARQLSGLKNSPHKGRPTLESLVGKDPFDLTFKDDIVGYLEKHYYLPETKAPVVLEEWQKERIFKPLLQKNQESILRRRNKEIPQVSDWYNIRKHTLALIGIPKKNSKSTMASMLANYFLFQDEDYGEILVTANSREQSSWIIFQKLQRSILMNPHQKQYCKITDDYIENKKTGTIARVVAPNYKTSAGFNPSLTIFDELWAYEKDSARRFYDEMTTSPSRKQPLTVIFSYAGYDEDSLLYEIYKRGLEGKDKKMFFLWSHDNLASWVTQEYLDTQRKRLRGNTYLRLHENRWTESEEQFIEADDWDSCVHRDHFPLLPNKDISIMVGVDASVKNDSSAVVAVTKRDNEIVLVQYRKWQPSQKNTMDFEESIEAYIKELNDWYTIKEVRYDPFQFHRSAMTLAKLHIPMAEFPQTVDRLTEMGQCLYQLIKGKNLILYEDKEMRQHALKCVAQETPRGWRIVKKQGTHKIDIIIALAIAVFAAVDMKTHKRSWIRIDTPDELLDKEEKDNYEDNDLWELVTSINI